MLTGSKHWTGPDRMEQPTKSIASWVRKVPHVSLSSFDGQKYSSQNDREYGEEYEENVRPQRSFNKFHQLMSWKIAI